MKFVQQILVRVLLVQDRLFSLLLLTGAVTYAVRTQLLIV